MQSDGRGLCAGHATAGWTTGGNKWQLVGSPGWCTPIHLQTLGLGTMAQRFLAGAHRDRGRYRRTAWRAAVRWFPLWPWAPPWALPPAGMYGS